MLVRVGDVLYYSCGHTGYVTDIQNDNYSLELSDGTNFVLTKNELYNGIIKGNIKFMSFSGDIKPPKFIKPFDF